MNTTRGFPNSKDASLTAGTCWMSAGLDVTDQQFVPERDGSHALFWARRGPEGNCMH